MFKIEFDSKPVSSDNDKYIQTKINIHGGSVNTNFLGKKKCQKKKHRASLYQ